MSMLINKINKITASRNAKVWAKILISCALISVFVYSYDLSKLWGLLSGLNIPLYLISLYLVISGVFLSTFKWSILLKVLGITLPYLQLLRLYYIGCFFNMFLPGAISGDIMRLELFRKKTGRLMRGGISVITERFSGILALWAIASVSFLFNHELFSGLSIRYLLFIIVLITSITLVSILFFSTTKKVLYFIASKLESLNLTIASNPFRKILVLADVMISSKHSMIKVFIISLVFQILSIVVKIIISLALGVEIDWWLFFLLTPITTTLLMIPITFQGIGLREWSHVVLFGMVSVPTHDILAVSTLVFSLIIVNSLFGGIVYILPFDQQAADGLQSNEGM